jgi:hypothetical protein
LSAKRHKAYGAALLLIAVGLAVGLKWPHENEPRSNPVELAPAALPASAAAAATPTDLSSLPPAAASTASTAPALVPLPPAQWPLQSTAQLASRPTPELAAQLHELRSCHAADTCGYAQTDSRAAHFAATAAMASRLKALAGRPEALPIAREFLSFQDGHVQSAALALLADAPPQADHAAAVLSMLKDNHDSVLLKQALPVLQNWQSKGLTQGLDDTLVKLLATGPHQVGLVLSAELLPFLHDGNFDRYQQLQSRLPEGRKREQLGQVLVEYQRLKTGG